MVKYRSIKKGEEYAILIGSSFFGREMPNGQFRQYRYKTKADAIKKVKELNKNLR